MLKAKSGKWDALAITVFSAVLISVTAAALFRSDKEADVAAATNATVVSSRAVRFKDDARGILVYDSGGSAPFAVLDREKNSFLMTAMRLAVLERDKNRVPDRDAPFLVARLSDGRLMLKDPALGREWALNAFGQTNAETFAALLPNGPKSR